MQGHSVWCLFSLDLWHGSKWAPELRIERNPDCGVESTSLSIIRQYDFRSRENLSRTFWEAPKMETQDQNQSPAKKIFKKSTSIYNIYPRVVYRSLELKLLGDRNGFSPLITRCRYSATRYRISATLWYLVSGIQKLRVAPEDGRLEIQIGDSSDTNRVQSRLELPEVLPGASLAFGRYRPTPVGCREVSRKSDTAPRTVIWFSNDPIWKSYRHQERFDFQMNSLENRITRIVGRILVNLTF